MADDTTLEDVFAECRRIGFGPTELGGLALAGAALADFCEFLRTIPDGAGYDEFLRRSRGGRGPSDAELRELGDGSVARLQDLLRGPDFTNTTWAERARWLRLVAEEFERAPPPYGPPDARCSFCGRSLEDAGGLLGGKGDARICGSCAARAVKALNRDPAT